MRRDFGMRWVVAVLAVTAGMGGAALAQNREKAWEVTPYFGLMTMGATGSVDGVPHAFPVSPELQADTAELTVENDYNFGFRFAYHWTKKHEVEFAFGGMGTTGQLDSNNHGSQGYQQDILTGRVDYIYNIPLHRRDKVMAFLTAGLGVVNISTFGQSADLDLQQTFEAFIGDENVPMYDFGAGIRIFGSPKVGVRFDVRRAGYSSSSTGDYTFMEYTVGLCLILGGA